MRSWRWSRRPRLRARRGPMDHWFDNVSRMLASPLPRRRVLAMIAGGVAGSAFGAIWPGRPAEAEVNCGPCTAPGMYICEGQLYPDATCSGCKFISCFCQICGPACPPGRTDCNGICCLPGQVCNGTLGCGAPCPEGFSPCGTGCCAPDFVCVAGNCVSCGCPPSKPYCIGGPGQQCSFLDETARQQVETL